MGSRGLGFSKSKTGKYSSVAINMSSFTRNDVDKRTVKNSMVYLHAIIDYMGVSDDVLPNINLFCKKPNRFNVIGSCQLNAFSEDGNNILINPKFFKDSRIIETDNKIVALYGDTFAHEYAHALESFLIKRNLSEVSDRINAWNDCLFAKGIIDNALRKMGKNTADWSKYAGTISDYAKKDHSECLAEVTKEFSHGGPQSKFVTTVMSEFKKEVRKYAKGYKKSK